MGGPPATSATAPPAPAGLVVLMVAGPVVLFPGVRPVYGQSDFYLAGHVAGVGNMTRRRGPRRGQPTQVTRIVSATGLMGTSMPRPVRIRVISSRFGVSRPDGTISTSHGP